MRRGTRGRGNVCTRLHYALLAAALWALCGAPALADEIVVAVNPKVDVEPITANDVRAIFLGERKYWDGTRVYPVAYPDGSDLMQDFLRQVLDMSVNEYRSWWIKRIFRNGDLPPVTEGSPADAARAVAIHPGGIGFFRSADLEGTTGLRPVLRLGP
jgi:ABC-type phosphate transport system substrate-binding protein